MIMMNKHKPVLVVAALSLVAAGVLIAVLSTVSSGGGDRTTIRLIGEGYAPLEALSEMVPEFERETGIAVEITQRDHQSVITEIEQEFAADRVTYDIILVPHRML